MARVKVVKRPRSDEDAKPNKRPRRAGPSEPAVAQEDAPVPLPPDFYDKLISMPFDIAFEIFKHLHPHTLLNLARTTKALRQFLMSYQSEPIWRACRRNAPRLPVCPPHLSHPHYIDLKFSPHCDNCGKEPSDGVYRLWIFSAKYCTPCKALMFYTPGRRGDPIREAVVRDLDYHEYWMYMNTIRGDYALESVVAKYARTHVPERRAFEKTWATLETIEQKQQFLNERIAYVEQCSEFVGAMGSLSHVEWNEAAKKASDTRIIAVLNRLKEEAPRYAEIVDTLTPEERERFRRPANAYSGPLVDIVWRHKVRRYAESVLNWILDIRREAQ